MDFNKSQEPLNSPILSAQAQALRWMLCVSDTTLFLSTTLQILPMAEPHSHCNARLASLKTRYYLHFILRYVFLFFFDKTIVPQTSRSLSSERFTRLKDEDNQAFLPPLHQSPGRTTRTCQQRGLLYNLVLEGASFGAASDLLIFMRLHIFFLVSPQCWALLWEQGWGRHQGLDVAPAFQSTLSAVG